ncbi:hypothetical protein EDD22DRAFT_961431 [Suillus occidentalis]|nr:hypothetical protein EDD22DRAFT_963713 [Suillus occidentalis]KAG1726368.1 hypothetical protein EDD22DRAFT_961431 [Suillus occidentalis]
MKAVGHKINPEGMRWAPDVHHIRCQEHILNLAACHFVDTVVPTPQATLMKKIRQVLDNGNDAELDTLNKQLSSMDVSNDDNNNTLFDTGDSLSKALALIKQIQKSPQAHAFFCKACKEENVPELELLQWIRTHWALLYKCLDRMLLLCQAVNCFTNLANESNKVPTLRNKTYNNFKLDQTQQSFSSAKHPTAWKTIPMLECLADQWKSMADDLQYLPIANAIKAGLKNVNKYFKKTSQSDMYFICLVLDPNYKLTYVEGW